MNASYNLYRANIIKPNAFAINALPSDANAVLRPFTPARATNKPFAIIPDCVPAIAIVDPIKRVAPADKPTTILYCIHAFVKPTTTSNIVSKLSAKNFIPTFKISPTPPASFAFKM